MASAQPISTTAPARIGQTTFMGIAWGGVGLTILFFVFRLIVRFKVFGRPQADDGLVFFAWVSLLINTVLWQFAQDGLYLNYAVSSGELYPPPPNYGHELEQYLRKSVAVIVFFYTGLWSVKFSFLVFFKRLGHNVRNQSVVWWTVLAITLASYFTCLGTIEYSCLATSFFYIETHCANSPGPVKFQRDTLRANMILDVVTDALIILVPVNLLWKVRLSVRKKLALSGIFAITVIIMVFAIIRSTVVTSYSNEPDQSWLYMWSSIEQAVSIIVACLASFPSLFKKSERAKHHRIPEGNPNGNSDGTSRRAFFFLGSKKSKESKEGTSDIALNKIGLQQVSTMIHGGSKNLPVPWREHQKPSFDSGENILPMDEAHIDH